MKVGIAQTQLKRPLRLCLVVQKNKFVKPNVQAKLRPFA
jgi:hypothetical protein